MKIFMGIPAVDALIHYKIWFRYLHWSKYYNLIPGVVPGARPVDNARNIMVKEFKKGDCDYLFCMDHDIVPPENALPKMLKHDVDVVTPVCLIFRNYDDYTYPRPASFKLTEKKEYAFHYGKGLTEVDVITGGCYLIKREVLEKMERPFFFEYFSDGTVKHTEERSFSFQARALGYKLYTDYDLICEHEKKSDAKRVNRALVRVEKKIKGETKNGNHAAKCSVECVM